MLTFVINTVQNGVIAERKSRYFVTVDMNGIIDTTDETNGSQPVNIDPQARVILK